MYDIDSDDSDDCDTRGLCDTCKYIRIRKFFDTSPCPEKRHNLTLEEILAEQTSCTLCHLIGHAIHISACALCRAPPPLPEDLTLFNPKKMFPTMKNGYVYLTSDESHWITNSENIQGLEASDLTYNLRKRGLDGRPSPPVLRIIVEFGVQQGLMGEIRLLASDTKRLKISPSFSHSQLVDEKVNVNLLKNVIQRCSKHPKCQGPKSSGPFPTNIRLIDTINHCIIPVDIGHGYVALSYTWGGDQQFKLLLENISRWSQPGGMPPLEVLPPTIRDSIILCKQLNQRYLWIDSLCITQNDPSTLRGQLEQMDLIYQCAEFTIIAAAGLGANAGLPGISTTGRKPEQLVETIQGLRLAAPLPSLSEAGKHSFWKTRGWTYQEQMLSRKALVFTERQSKVYYECPTGIYCEDQFPYAPCDEGEIVLEINREEGRAGLERLPLNSPSRPEDFASETEHDTPFNSFRLYQSAVANYTARNLGNPTDILNAFIGVANAFQAYSGMRGFVGGLPVMGLSDALLWKPLQNTLVRRQCLNPVTGRRFPAWSWAGWIGAVTVARGSDVLAREALVSEWAVVYGLPESQEPTTMALPSVEIDDFRDPSLFSRSPTPWNLLHAHTLRYRSSVCYGFQIIMRTPEWVGLCSWDTSERSTPHSACICDTSGVCIGSLLPDNRTAVPSCKGNYALIAVSRGWHPNVHYSRGFSMRETGGVEVYNILFGEKCDEDIERRGTGVVVAAQWENVETLEEVVSLI